MDVLVDVVVVGQLPRDFSSSFVFAPRMQVPARLPVVSDLLQPQIPMQSLPHLMAKQWFVVGVEVVLVVEVVVVTVVEVVGHSPSSISSAFVFAPAMQVPALLPVMSALLQPQTPVQSFPHLMAMHRVGGDGVVVVAVTVLVAVAEVTVVVEVVVIEVVEVMLLVDVLDVTVVRVDDSVGVVGATVPTTSHPHVTGQKSRPSSIEHVAEIAATLSLLGQNALSTRPSIQTAIGSTVDVVVNFVDVVNVEEVVFARQPHATGQTFSIADTWHTWLVTAASGHRLSFRPSAHTTVVVVAVSVVEVVVDVFVSVTVEVEVAVVAVVVVAVVDMKQSPTIRLKVVPVFSAEGDVL